MPSAPWKLRPCGEGGANDEDGTHDDSERKDDAMTSNLRIGVIGAGGRGNVVRFAHHPETGVRVVAAADPNPGALESFRHQYGNDTYVTDDYQKFLREADCSAVFICSPDFCHEEQSVATLESGRDVYLEKPMAITMAGCDRILDAAFRNKRKLYVGHNMRHMPVILKMKELIDSGRIGKVKAIQLQCIGELSRRIWRTAAVQEKPAFFQPEEIAGTVLPVLTLAIPLSGFLGQVIRDEFDKVLDAHVSGNDIFEAIYLVNSSGQVVSVGLPSARRPYRDDYLGTDLSRRDFLVDAQVTGKSQWSDTFLSIISGRVSVALAMPVRRQVPGLHLHDPLTAAQIRS